MSRLARFTPALTLVMTLAAPPLLGWAQPPDSLPPPQLVARVALPHVEGRIDHLALDPQRHRLFVSCPGNHSVEIVDLVSGRAFRSMHDWSEPQGALYATSSDRVFIADGDGSVVVLDAGVLEKLNSTKLGDDADNIREDAGAHRVYVGFGAGGITALESSHGARQGTATFGGHPEAFAIDPGSSRIFVNVPEQRQIVVIDRKTFRIVDRWSLAPFGGNYPMALDALRHRLYVGGRGPARLLVLDSSTGQRLQALALCGDVDDLWLDGPNQRIYASCGTGSLDVFTTAGPQVQLLGSLATAAGARTSLFVQPAHRLYVAVPHRGAQRAEIRIYEVR